MAKITDPLYLEYAECAFYILKENTIGFDSVYEDYILELIGSEGLRALKDFRYLEACGVVNGRQLYVLR